MLYDVLPGPAPCLRLVGASFWSSHGSPLDHLLGLRRRLLRAALARDVRIAVLHRAQWLIHWIEGPPRAVESAWRRMQRLPQQQAFRLLHRSPGRSTLQQPVHIASVFRPEAPQQLARYLAALPVLHAPAAEPARLWHELSAPAAVTPCSRVVIASALEHEGIDLLRRVAHRKHADVVYQRFADSDLTQFDSGAAYADPEVASGCAVRAQVLSRRGLGHPLLRGGPPAVRELVLLPGIQESRCARMVDAVQPLLADCGNGLRVHVIGREPAMVALASRLLRPAGNIHPVLAGTTRSVHESAAWVERLLQEAAEADGCLRKARMA